MPKPEKDRISVAMCTYNGERFLAQQLVSIAQQSRPPDELVVCDDGSTDRTVAMIREFAVSVRYPVRVFENEHNLGVAANFERAIRLCEGNLIALADQDDIWYPIRLERSEQELTAHPEAGLIFPMRTSSMTRTSRPVQRFGSGSLSRESASRICLPDDTWFWQSTGLSPELR